MTQIMTGIRVVELATWTFVPAAGAILADWGADVIKIEHPVRPDPQRALRRTGDADTGGISPLMEQGNRGKRSLAMDIRTEAGREAFYRLIESADVFLTNWLPSARQKALIDVEHLKHRNPRLVYVRGHGQGAEGPDADKPGFDGTSYVARGGFAQAMTPPGAEWPLTGSSAVGDLPGSVTLAGAICGGLFHRERTGEAGVIDVSLLGLAMWTIAPDIVDAGLRGAERPKMSREDNLNPVSIMYKTKDGRVLKLSMFESDRFFRDLCRHLGCEELADDPRFSDAERRAANNHACVAALDAVFGQYTMDEIRERFADLKGAWAMVQKAPELLEDPQAVANGYLPVIKAEGRRDVVVVAPPIQFDGVAAGELSPCPEHGQHTEEVLLDLGLDWSDLAGMKDAGVIL